MSLEQRGYLVVVDELLQLVSMHHNVETTHLGQPELLPIHTGEAHLWRGERERQRIYDMTSSMTYISYGSIHYLKNNATQFNHFSISPLDKNPREEDE